MLAAVCAWAGRREGVEAMSESRNIGGEDRNLSNLPKWAQHYIERLERDWSRAEEKLHAMDTGQSNVRIQGWHRDHTYLPPDSAIEFITATREYGRGENSYMHEAGFQVQIREHYGLMQGNRKRETVTGIQVISVGGVGFTIYPQSSNVVFMQTEAP